MEPQEREKVVNRFVDDEEVDTAVKEAVRRALAEHKRKGNAIAVWEEGEVRIVSPEEIQVPEEDAWDDSRQSC